MSNIQPISTDKPMELGAFVRTSRLDDSLFSKELAPHYMQLATKLASSSLVPKSFQGKPQDLFICWAMGYQIGMSPEQSMQCIAVINGKPAMWGDDMLALCMVHPDFEDIIEEPILNEQGAVFGYKCVVKRKGRADKVNKFDLNDAKKAGLLAKGGVWTQYPERMLKLRARGFTLRDAFPDALKGIKPREEVEDYIDAEYQEVPEGTSRTELLKKDYLTKTGHINETINSNSTNEMDSLSPLSTNENPITTEKNEITKTETNLHIEIKRLIDSNGLSEEDVLKSLAFYEVDKIEDLSLEAARHFYTKLAVSI